MQVITALLCPKKELAGQEDGRSKLTRPVTNATRLFIGLVYSKSIAGTTLSPFLFASVKNPD
jgi:hypothetical protein